VFYLSQLPICIEGALKRGRGKLKSIVDLKRLTSLNVFLQNVLYSIFKMSSEVFQVINIFVTKDTCI
jgi:hypothetical protein